MERPAPTEEEPQHLCLWMHLCLDKGYDNLCLDKGYDNGPTEVVVAERGYVSHIRRIGEEKKDAAGEKTHPARRWVMERTFSWLSRWLSKLL